MYCRNCGNKLDDNAYVCVKCGILVDRNDNVPSRSISKEKKKDTNVTGILSIVFSSLSVLCGFGSLTMDISNVGMYTKVLDRIIYSLDLIGFPLALMIVSFILALANKGKLCNKIGLSLSLLSLFLIITEVLVVIFY